MQLLQSEARSIRLKRTRVGNSMGQKFYRQERRIDYQRRSKSLRRIRRNRL
jgi:hypothetical protein